MKSTSVLVAVIAAFMISSCSKEESPEESGAGAAASEGITTERYLAYTYPEPEKAVRLQEELHKASIPFEPFSDSSGNRGVRVSGEYVDQFKAVEQKTFGEMPPACDSSGYEQGSAELAKGRAVLQSAGIPYREIQFEGFSWLVWERKYREKVISLPEFSTAADDVECHRE